MALMSINGNARMLSMVLLPLTIEMVENEATPTEKEGEVGELE